MSKTRDRIAELEKHVRRLTKALVLADRAMNHMGDIMNDMDIVQDEDIKITAPAFAAVKAAIGTKVKP